MNVLKTPILLTMMSVIASCADRSVPPIEDQMVRTAKIMTIEASAPETELQFVGRVEALQTVDLSFQVGGSLESLPILEGQQIKQGELIAALEAKDFELAVREAQAQFKLASQDLDRKREVLKRKGIAKSAVEDAETIKQLRQVQVERALEAQSDSRLVAPFDAYVAHRYIDNHSNVNPHAPIVRLHDLSELAIVTSIPELLLATSNPEQVMQMNANFAFSGGRQFPLTIRENRGEAEPFSQTYEVSFAMESQPDLNILPGMTATVTIKLKDVDSRSTITLIPTSAIVADTQSNLSVWIFDASSGKVTRRAITTGVPNGDLIPITEGLEPGEQIVTAGASQLNDGMRVTPFNSGANNDG